MILKKVRQFGDNLLVCTRDHGPKLGLQWLHAKIVKQLGVTKGGYSVQPRSALHPIFLRRGTSDFFVFDQIFIQREYAPLGNLAAGCILDLGANIGLASTWFLSAYPNAQVLAVEANPDNYHAIQDNLAPYGERAQVLLGGVWSRCADLTVVRRSEWEWDAQVCEAQPGDSPEDVIKGWDIPYLMGLGNFKHIDLLKIDIEGTELEIFRDGADRWLPLTRNICIELHGDECEQAFFKALEEYDFDLSHSGELTICTKLSRKVGGVGQVSSVAL